MNIKNASFNKCSSFKCKACCKYIIEKPANGKNKNKKEVILIRAKKCFNESIKCIFIIHRIFF